jgi:6-phosphofructokinase 2
MIYTVTLNPALDRALEVNELVPDDANRIRWECSYAGGKGIDASRVIQVLGGESVALGFVGGFHGMELEQRLLRQGVRCDFVETRGETRTNILIFEKNKKTHTSLNASGQKVNEVEIGELLDKVRKVVDPSYFIVSGSVPEGVPVDIYEKIINIVRARGVLVALDADGEVMRRGLSAMPDFIKPNIHELGRLVERRLSTVEDVLEATQIVRGWGVSTILVSMGDAGALLVSNGARLLGIPPKVDVDSTVGAGDSFLAGFILAHSRGEDPKSCLRLAVAAGAAAAMTPGTELARKNDVEEILPHVTIEDVK